MHSESSSSPPVPGLSSGARIERVVVVGAGAIGGSIAVLLADAGMPVELVARGEHGARIRAEGLTLRTPERALTLRLPCTATVAEVDWRAGDLALVATKLGDARAVLDELVSRAGPALPVAMATNGLHGERWAAERFACALAMLVWMPATHLVPGEVLLHSRGGPGVLDCGPARGDERLRVSETLCARLRDAGFDSVARRDIARWKLAKLLSNLGNAAQALVTDDWQRVAAAARAEGERVLAARGDDHASIEDLRARAGGIELGEIEGAPRAGGSTWQSRRRGKPLETPYLQGALLELAHAARLAAPINEALARASREPRDYSAEEFLPRAADEGAARG